MRSAFCSSLPVSRLRNPTRPEVCLRRRQLYRARISRQLVTAQQVSTTEQERPPPAQTLPYTLHDWNFKSFNVQYAMAGVSPETNHLPAMILVHGFGANCQHWRHNLAPLAQHGFRIYAIDLLGFGLGDKPTPGTLDADGQPVSYNFDYWTEQLHTFAREIAEPTGRPVFLVANSIGAMVIMQMATENPSLVAAQILISPSLRLLNVRKRSWVQDVTAPFLMKVLSYRPLGSYFLDSLSRPTQLRKVLLNAYAVSEAVDDELVSILAEPAFTNGALDVFLSFIMYDDGPIPEDFLPELTQPSLILWGEDDVFEPLELGQAFRHYATVESFVPLQDVGHCAHDEKPELVNKLIAEFANKHLSRATIPSA